MLLSIFSYLYSICLSIFFGSSIFLGYITAPYIFKTLNSRNEAGNMVGALLHKFSMIGYITQILMAIAGYILYLNRGGMIIFIIPLIILLLLLFSENLISKKMNNLKKRMGSIDEVSKEDPKRKQFNSLHKLSVKLFLLNELLCLPLFYIILVK